MTAPAPGPCLLLTAALVSGVHLEVGRSVEALMYKPALQPQESIPPPGTYLLRSRAGAPCVRATLGAEFMVLEQKTWYFNLEPSRVRVSGACGNTMAVLSLTLPDNAASLQFYFTKEKKVYYVRKITAHLSPMPVCRNCSSQSFAGLVDHEKLFLCDGGSGFKCDSASLLHLSPVFRLKLVPLQIQAFSVPKKQFAKEVECRADYNKRVIPVVLGGTAVGLLLIALLSYLIIRDRRRAEYESL